MVTKEQVDRAKADYDAADDAALRPPLTCGD